MLTFTCPYLPFHDRLWRGASRFIESSAPIAHIKKMVFRMLLAVHAAANAAAGPAPNAAALLAAGVRQTRINQVDGYVLGGAPGTVQWVEDEAALAMAQGPGALAARLAATSAIGITQATWVFGLGDLTQVITAAVAEANTAADEAAASYVAARPAAVRAAQLALRTPRVIALVKRSAVSAVYVAAEVGRVAAARAAHHAALAAQAAPLAAAVAEAAAASVAAATLATAARRAAQLAVVVDALAQLESSLSPDAVKHLIASTGQVFSPDLDLAGESKVVVIKRHHPRFRELLQAYEHAYPMGTIINAYSTATPLTAALFERMSDAEKASSVMLPMPLDVPEDSLTPVQRAFGILLRTMLAAEGAAAIPRIWCVTVRNLPLVLGWLFTIAGIPWLASAVYTYSGVRIRRVVGEGRVPPHLAQARACQSWFSVCLGFGQNGCLPPFLLVVLHRLPCLVNGGGAHSQAIVTQLIYRVSHTWMTLFHGRRANPLRCYWIRMRDFPLVAVGGTPGGLALAGQARLAVAAAVAGAGGAAAPVGLRTAHVAVIELGHGRGRFLPHAILPPL